MAGGRLRRVEHQHEDPRRLAVRRAALDSLRLDAYRHGRAADAVRAFSEAGISITYMYSFLLRGKGILVFRTDNTELARKAIAEYNLRYISEEDLASWS